MGSVVAFCIEKSCRPTCASGYSRALPREIDRERQRSDVGLEIRVDIRIRIRKPHNSGIDTRRREHPLRESCRQFSGRVRRSTSNTSNWARAQTPFAWVPRPSGRCCLAAAFACIKRTLSAISSMSDCSRARFRSASLPVTPNHLVRNSMTGTHPRFGDQLDRGDAWQKAVGGGFRRNEA